MISIVDDKQPFYKRSCVRTTEPARGGAEFITFARASAPTPIQNSHQLLVQLCAR